MMARVKIFEPISLNLHDSTLRTFLQEILNTGQSATIKIVQVERKNLDPVLQVKSRMAGEDSNQEGSSDEQKEVVFPEPTDQDATTHIIIATDLYGVAMTSSGSTKKLVSTVVLDSNDPKITNEIYDINPMVPKEIMVDTSIESEIKGFKPKKQKISVYVGSNVFYLDVSDPDNPTITR